MAHHFISLNFEASNRQKGYLSYCHAFKNKTRSTSNYDRRYGRIIQIYITELIARIIH